MWGLVVWHLPLSQHGLAPGSAAGLAGGSSRCCSVQVSIVVLWRLALTPASVVLLLLLVCVVAVEVDDSAFLDLMEGGEMMMDDSEEEEEK